MKDLMKTFKSGQALPLPQVHIKTEKGKTRRETLLEVYHHKNIGYIPNLFLDYNFLVSKYMNEHPGFESGKDWFGVEWTYMPEQQSSSLTPGCAPLISDIEDWRDQVTFPDLDSVDWAACAAEETACWDRKNRMSMIMIENGIFERSQHLLGFENAVVDMLVEPEAYEDLLDALTDFKCRVLEIIGTYYKPDIVMCHDDYGQNSAMMMSPEKWREVFKPRIKRLVDTAHKYGMIYEHHSCGYITPIVGDLVEIGVDSLNPLQVCNDLPAIKEKYGDKLTLVGGFDSQGYLDNTDISKKEIRSDVKRAYDTLAPGGGYVSLPIVINYSNCAPAILMEHYKSSKKYA